MGKREAEGHNEKSWTHWSAAVTPGENIDACLVRNLKIKCIIVSLFAGRIVIRVSSSCQSCERGGTVHQRSAAF